MWYHVLVNEYLRMDIVLTIIKLILSTWCLYTQYILRVFRAESFEEIRFKTVARRITQAFCSWLNMRNHLVKILSSQSLYTASQAAKNPPKWCTGQYFIPRTIGILHDTNRSLVRISA